MTSSSPPVGATNDASGVESCVIGRSETSLVLTRIEQSHDGSARLIRAGVRAPSVDVDTVAYESEGYEGLARFFEGLADDWRGWDGQRRYATIEGDLQLIARHDGHVRLTVVLCSSAVADWIFRCDLVVEAGEELAAAARDVRLLVGPQP